MRVHGMKISESIEKLVPYRPGKPIAETQREFGLQEVIKLASNENPLGTSPAVVRALQASLSDLHRYPDPGCYEVVQTVSRLWKIPAAQIVVGNGSNELIDLLVRIFCEPGEAILTFQSAFVAYGVCARAARVEVIESPLKKDFTPDFTALTEELKTNPDIRLVFLPNPNNPTGALADPGELRRFLELFANDPHRLLVLDEAYVEYVRDHKYESGLALLSQLPRLVVVRTLSKAYGLAGLRVGVLLGPEWVVQLIHKVRNPFNVNTLAQAAAVAALQDVDFVQRSRTLNSMELERVEDFLRQKGVSYIPSQANFVLFDTHQDGESVFQKLLRRGVILRPVGAYGLPQHLRMSIGLPEENDRALQALSEVLGW